jgi:hypothetical protein
MPTIGLELEVFKNPYRVIPFLECYCDEGKISGFGRATFLAFWDMSKYYV